MLTPNQYERLAPYAPVIHLAADSKSIATTSPWETISQINSEIGNPPINGYCPTCVLETYTNMSRLIKEYENQNKTQ